MVASEAAMTVLAAIGMVLAFLFFPVAMVMTAIGAMIAGLHGAIVGAIIGSLITFARS
jgi:hypothetical protein